MESPEIIRMGGKNGKIHLTFNMQEQPINQQLKNNAFGTLTLQNIF